MGHDLSLYAGLSIASFVAVIILAAVADSIVKSAREFARRDMAAFLSVVILGLIVVGFLFTQAFAGNPTDLTIVTSAALGGVSLVAYKARGSPARRAGSRMTRPRRGEDHSYARLLLAAPLAIIAVLGALLLFLVNSHVPTLIALASAAVVGIVAVVAVVTAGSFDLRRRGQLSEARTVDLLKAGLSTLRHLLPTSVFGRASGRSKANFADDD